MAAPAGPKAGKPNKPKIRMLFPIKLMMTADTLAIIGNLVSPHSLMEDEIHCDNANGTNPIVII